jgi:hypothetical protein
MTTTISKKMYKNLMTIVVVLLPVCSKNLRGTVSLSYVDKKYIKTFKKCKKNSAAIFSDAGLHLTGKKSPQLSDDSQLCIFTATQIQR